MSNERLRRNMLWFAGIFVVLGIIIIYVRNAQVQKTGAGQDLYVSPGEWHTDRYEDGKIKAQGILKNGYVKDGDWNYYREDGSVEMVEVYKNGILRAMEPDTSITPPDTIPKLKDSVNHHP